MTSQHMVGRISGIPIVLDMTFILLCLFFGSSFLVIGSNASLLIAVMVMVGGVGSVLVHELAHAWAGRICGIGTTHIELNGLGGLCYLERSGRTRQEEIFILLAGPASNLALWALFHWLGHWAVVLAVPGGDTDFDAETVPRALELLQPVLSGIYLLASVNIMMFVFNLMPSFPLDGGRALREVLAPRIGGPAATRLVACLGFVVVAYCLYTALRGGGALGVLLAIHLGLANYAAYQVDGRTPWKRRN